MPFPRLRRQKIENQKKNKNLIALFIQREVLIGQDCGQLSEVRFPPLAICYSCSARQAKRVEHYQPSWHPVLFTQPTQSGPTPRHSQSEVACGQTAECEWRSGATERRMVRETPGSTPARHKHINNHSQTNKQTNSPCPLAAVSSQMTSSQTLTRWLSAKTSLDLPGRNSHQISVMLMLRL